MNRLSVLLSFCILPLMGAVAFADDAPGSGIAPHFPGYGGHMMWGWGGGWGPGFGFHPVIMILTLVGLIVVVMWIVRLIASGFGHPHWLHNHAGSVPPARNRALEILEERLAKGEIGKDEFEEKRKLIGS